MDKEKIKCNYNCVDCGLYSAVTSNGIEYVEYNCLVTGKDVKIYENGKVEVF